MGWAYCGTDKKGRYIGYGVAATCDYPDCGTKIDRGLGYACGGMHGEREDYCDGYFCTKHLFLGGPDGEALCETCFEEYAKTHPLHDPDDCRTCEGGENAPNKLWTCPACETLYSPVEE